MRELHSPSCRRLVTILCCLLLVGSIIGGAGIAHAQDGAPSLEAAVARALAAQAGGPGDAAIHVAPVERSGGWTFGTVIVLNAGDDETAPEGTYFLAREQGQRWRAEVRPAAGFNRWVDDAPADLLSAELRRALGGGLRGATTGGSLRLSMPFPAGETWWLGGGPHGDDRPPADRPWSALDFMRDEVGATSGRILAAADGVVTLPCATAAGRGPLVWILHANGWETVYFHVADTAVDAGQNVRRGQFLGMTSEIVNFGPCTGTAVGRHVHFAIKQGTNVPNIAGTAIGGWMVEEGASAYAGCLFKANTQQRSCRNQSFRNDGSIGSGSKAALPNRIKGGKEVRVTLTNLPPNRKINVGVVFDGKVKQFKAVNTDSNGRVAFKARFPKPRATTTAYFEARAQGIGFLVAKEFQLKK